MEDVFRTIVVTAANRTAARDAVLTLYPGENPFLGKYTNVQGSTITTHYMMSGDMPEDMATLFDAGGSAAALAVHCSGGQSPEQVCQLLGLYKTKVVL